MIETRIAELERDNGRTRAMLFAALARLAALEEFCGLDKPRREAPPGLPVKMVADLTHRSESGLRKLGRGGKIGAQWHGGRLFIDETTVPAKR